MPRRVLVTAALPYANGSPHLGHMLEFIQTAVYVRARMHVEHAKVYDDFGVGYDIFHTTHSEETRRHAEAIYTAMRDAGATATRNVAQLYCPKDQMFLPDRFVKGVCPKC